MKTRPRFYLSNPIDSYEPVASCDDPLASLAARYIEARAAAIELRNELVASLRDAIAAAVSSLDTRNYDDSVQDATVALLESIWISNVATGVNDWPKWTYGFVRNTILRKQRCNESRIIEASTRRHNGKAMMRLNDEEFVPSFEERDRLKRAVERLPAAEQQIMSLHLEGLTRQQIAAATGKKYETVRRALNKARLKVIKAVA